jgi:hypothetical protein
MVEYILVHGIRIAKSYEPETFGRLTTIGPQFKLPINSKGHRRDFQVCACVCGAVCMKLRSHLVRSETQSCGCLRKELGYKKHIAHGESGTTPEYRSWGLMKDRCYNPSNKAFHNYGGRGIKVCDRWSGPSGFQNFLEDMGRRPASDHSIDRIDVNGDYCPENCRWATRKEQCRNKRSNKLLTWEGKTQCMSQWADDFAISYVCLKSRLRRGWLVEKALTTPTKR